MKIEDHTTKTQRLEATLAKLDLERDYELCLEGYMLAGTHLLNALLHKHSVTRENFDLNHTDSRVLETPIADNLRPVFAALKRIEDLRPDYLRGSKSWTTDEARTCRESYAAIKQFAEAGLR